MPVTVRSIAPFLDRGRWFMYKTRVGGWYRGAMRSPETKGDLSKRPEQERNEVTIVDVATEVCFSCCSGISDCK